MVKSTLERESKVPEAVAGPVGNQSLLIHVDSHLMVQWCAFMLSHLLQSMIVGKKRSLLDCMVLSECI